jgi:hypothetical protein
MRCISKPDRPLGDAMARIGQEPVGARRFIGPMDRQGSRPPSAARRRARHGFERQPHPWRTGDECLERPLRMHLLSSAVRVQPVRRCGALRPAAGERSQRRWLGGRPRTGRGALSRQSLAHLLPRRRRLRQSRCLWLPRSGADQIRHPPARQPCLAGAHRLSAQAPCRPPLP